MKIVADNFKFHFETFPHISTDLQPTAPSQAFFAYTANSPKAKKIGS